MNRMIIKTSNLGHDVSVYGIETTATIANIKKIDKKYGMQYRHQSTHISQLEEGAHKEGFEFNIMEIFLENSNKFDEAREIKHDYYANFGNY